MILNFIVRMCASHESARSLARPFSFTFIIFFSVGFSRMHLQSFFLSFRFNFFPIFFSSSCVSFFQLDDCIRLRIDVFFFHALKSFGLLFSIDITSIYYAIMVQHSISIVFVFRFWFCMFANDLFDSYCRACNNTCVCEFESFVWCIC